MSRMVIEVLFPEYNNLYGDRGNREYLARKLKLAGYDVEVIETSLFDKPMFVENQVDFLLIGPCQEKHQLVEIEHLKEYAHALKNRIDNGGVILATGNAFELFGQYIENPKGEKIECLGFYPYYAKQFSRLRYNDCSVGEFSGMKIVGFKNLLSHSYGENPYPFLNMKKGCGMNKENKVEGVKHNNLFATYHTGPILPLNPQFTDYLIKIVDNNYESVTLGYEEQAYESRLKELLK
jgi:CobQ-like glutamine amidotransferase family enzyme